MTYQEAMLQESKAPAEELPYLEEEESDCRVEYQGVVCCLGSRTA